jgi:CheY-like chemotaxis protein
MQVSGQNVKKYGGTGLGLSITKKLIEIMHGRITVESLLGKGSTFYVEFQNIQIAATDLLPELIEKSYLEKYKFSNEKVLVVDDIETNRLLLQELLSKVGLFVKTAANGNEAVHVCKREEPALIITDLVMPVMDGFDLARKLKGNSVYSHIPIIALSASSTQILPDGTMFDDFLIKPVQTEKLLSKIAKYLGNQLNVKTIIPTRKKTEVKNDSIEPELLAVLKKQLHPLLEKLELSIIISNVKKLADLLILLGKQYQFELMVSIGDEMMKSAECYDIVKIKSSLKQIEKILHEDMPYGKFD